MGTLRGRHTQATQELKALYALKNEEAQRALLTSIEKEYGASLRVIERCISFRALRRVNGWSPLFIPRRECCLSCVHYSPYFHDDEEGVTRESGTGTCERALHEMVIELSGLPLPNVWDVAEKMCPPTPTSDEEWCEGYERGGS